MAYTRRGTRVPVHISVGITSLDTTSWFSEPALVILANQHGCGIRTRRPMRVGTFVILERLPGKPKTATARVVNCISLGEYENFWLLGLELQEPGNIWGIETPPDDWLPHQPLTLMERVSNIWQSVSLKKKSEHEVLH